jgi:hypothetical protein
MTFIFYQISDFSVNLRNPVEKKITPYAVWLQERLGL